MKRSFPVDALSENLHTPEAVIKSFPQEIVLVTQGPFPPPPLAESTNQLPSSPMFTVEDGPCKDLGKGGYIYEVKSDIFPAATSMSGGLIREGSFVLKLDLCARFTGTQMPMRCIT
jgi:hypothetical protein